MPVGCGSVWIIDQHFIGATVTPLERQSPLVVDSYMPGAAVFLQVFTNDRCFNVTLGVSFGGAGAQFDGIQSTHQSELELRVSTLRHHDKRLGAPGFPLEPLTTGKDKFRLRCSGYKKPKDRANRRGRDPQPKANGLIPNARTPGLR